MFMFLIIKNFSNYKMMESIMQVIMNNKLWKIKQIYYKNNNPNKTIKVIMPLLINFNLNNKEIIKIQHIFNNKIQKMKMKMMMIDFIYTTKSEISYQIKLFKFIL